LYYRQAFQPSSAWRELSGRQRGALLYKLADLIEQNKHELAILESLNNGKTYNQALNQDVARQA
jgi:acyl-CoA reductase-like NAD-dependent aldehyde dehydrogenase